MILIINGAPGVGKSKTAESLNLKISQSAWIDGDWLLAINPWTGVDQERQLRYQQIAVVAKNYHDFGLTTIIISFVYPGQNGLAEQISLLEKIDQVKVVSLVVDPEILTHRHSTDPRDREKLENALDLNEKIKQLPDTEFIDNSEMTLEQTAEAVLQKIK